MVHPLALWDAPFLPAALPGPSWPLRRAATLPLAARRQLAAQLVALVAFLLGQGYYPDRGCLRGCVFVRTKMGYWLRLTCFPRWSLDHPRLVQALARGRKGERLPPLLLLPLLNQLIPELRHLLVQVEDPWAFPQVWLRELTSRDRGRAFAHPLGWGRFLWARRFHIPTEAGVFWVDEPGLLDRLSQLPGMQTGEMDEESLARVHARALAAGGPGIFLTATPIPGLPSLPFTGAEAIWCLLPPGSEVEAQRLLAGVMSGDAMAAGVALAETVRRLWAGGERAAEEVEHWLSYRAQRLASLLAQSGVGLSEAEAAALTGSGEPLRELARFRLVVPRFGRWFWAGGGHGDPAVLAAVAEQLPEGPLRWALRDEEPTRVLQWCEEALQRGEPARVLGLSPLSRVVPGLSCLMAEAGLTAGWLAWSEPWVRQCSGAVGSVLQAWFAAATGEEEQLQQHLATLTRQREALLPPRLRARAWLLRAALRERAGDEAGARELGLAVLNMPSLPGHLLAEAAYLAGQEALERLWQAPEHGGVPPQRLLHFLGIRAAKRGDYPGALRFFHKALALGGGHNPLQVGELLADAGAAAMLSDQPLEAERFFSAAEFWLKLAGSRRGVRLVTFNRAVLANDRLQWKKAQEFLLRSQQASRQEAPDGDDFALIEQARSWLACGRWPEAEAITQKLGPRLAGLPEGHPLKQGWAVVQAHLAVARGQVDQLEFWAAQAEPSERALLQALLASRRGLLPEEGLPPRWGVTVSAELLALARVDPLKLEGAAWRALREQGVEGAVGMARALHLGPLWGVDLAPLRPMLGHLRGTLQAAELTPWLLLAQAPVGRDWPHLLRLVDRLLDRQGDFWQGEEWGELAQALGLTGLRVRWAGRDLLCWGRLEGLWSEAMGPFGVEVAGAGDSEVVAVLAMLLRRAPLPLQKTPEADPFALTGQSSAMAALRQEIARLAPLPVTVLILGEPGTGKERVARALHRASGRRGEFVAVNCAGLPESLLEAELFGVVRGAFTGADRDRAGLVEQAEGGTLFLDEVGELPLAMQAKLLRLLQEKEVRRVGGTRARPVDVRFLAATNRDLLQAVHEGRFRRDLYDRLAMVTLRLPPLRERLEDLPYLLAELVNQFAGQFGLGQMAVEPEVVQVLAAHSWPGNVRELEAVVVQSLVRCRPGERLAVHHLPSQLGPVRASPELPPLLPLEAAERDFLRAYFQRLLEAAGGNRTRAAKLAGISRPALLYRLRQLGLQEKLRS